MTKQEKSIQRYKEAGWIFVSYEERKLNNKFFKVARMSMPNSNQKDIFINNRGGIGGFASNLGI